MTVRAVLARIGGVALAAAAATGPVACEGCRGGTNGTTNVPATPDPGPPTVRLYLVSDLAGALEPCGCTKDQLGGLDHAAAWMASERAKAPNAVLATAGPLFFMDPLLKPEKVAQDTTKAETLAGAMKRLNLAAFAPGRNDWAGGYQTLERLKATSGGALLASNLTGGAPVGGGPIVREVDGVKVGFVGVSLAAAAGASGTPRGVPGTPGGAATAGGTVEAGPEAGPALAQVSTPVDAVRKDVAAVKARGARIVVALAAVGRGEAKRIAEAVPELTAILVGSPEGSGEGNTATAPAERVGNVVVIETANHLQAVAVLDLWVRGEGAFADASGLEQSRRREELTRRIDDLRGRIVAWEKDGKIAKTDLDARRADVAKLEAERATLDVQPPPETGSFFRYTVKEIREGLGAEPAITDLLRAYYKTVNDNNREAFKNRTPRPHDAKTPVYVGIEVCTTCHEDARKVWDHTAHAKAYATLSTQFKEFNLDCVSCHVTGYELPGGSTVTHVDRLKDVQCEVCHGPGSRHAINPNTVRPETPKPKSDMCLSCHHPPHVHTFDAPAKMADILGPGHGQKAP